MEPRLNLILGDQLNWDSFIWQDVDKSRDWFWMAEVSEESTGTPSSKQRSTVFLSAMRHFAEGIRSAGFKLDYISLADGHPNFRSALTDTLKRLDVSKIRCVLPGDMRIVMELETVFRHHHINYEWLADKHFIAHRGEFRTWMHGRKQARMEHWYRHLRKSRHILMDKDKQPAGGRWNFDKDNRKTFSQTGPGDLPGNGGGEIDALTRSVIDDINMFVPNLPGKIDHFDWPVTRQQALQQLDAFIRLRLPQFGDYQDAMWTGEPFLYHARLSSSLNLKLLNPLEVIRAAEQAYDAGTAPLNAVEGFIRQILGWREYIRGLYWYYREQWPDYNQLEASRSLPGFYWDADTDMHCLHQSLSQVLAYGYGHHIQRLMVTGLFSLLWGVKPDAIHRWYLGMYVDAVGWVEVPNTIGMSQFADGGIVGSKPYIASGAYINRMSNYCSHCVYDPKQAEGDKACPFTTLYWHFIDRHQSWLSGHPRLGMQVKNWFNKSDHQQQQIRDQAEWLFEHLEQSTKKDTG